jgi:hypothetical protein
MSNFKVSTWFDKEKMKEVFGIKMRKDGKWYNVAENGKALFFSSKKKALAKIEKLRTSQ